MNKNIARRLKRLRSYLRRSKLDAMFVTNTVNVSYLSGFTGDSSALIITDSKAIFVTDFRFTEQAGEECKGFEVLARTDGMFKAAARRVKKLGVAKLGFEPNAITFQAAGQLRDELDNIEMVKTDGPVEQLRTIKDREEIKAIQAAIGAIEKCIEHIRSFLVPGIRECDITAEMEYFVRRLGFDGMAFPPIVAFGPRSSLPHARATARRLRKGDPVLIDCGVSGAGYVSDLTRVLFHNKIPHRFEHIYRIVLEAQKRAIAKVRPGAQAKDIDAAARRHIANAGFGRKFGHGLGHGIGMQVHEGPSISAAAPVVLKRGMVFTVEPGIYLPGFGGVRIEDDVLVTASGVRVLSSAPKALKDIVI